MEKIKWVLTDLSGVLVPLVFRNPDGYRYKTRFFKSEDLEGIYYTKEYKNYMLGMLSHEQTVGNYLKKRKLDLDVSEFDEILKQDIVPMPGMVPLIERLAEKYKIVLATNEGKMNMKYKVERSGIMPYLTRIIPSYLLRDKKPSLSFYKKALRLIDAAPDECVFIDDYAPNIAAAKTLGMTSILFTDTISLTEELTKLHMLQ